MTRRISAQPQALILDDDPMTVASLSKRLEAVGVVPFGTVSPSQALRHLGARGTRPVAAIVGVDAAVGEPGSGHGAAVLARLFSQ